MRMRAHRNAQSNAQSAILMKFRMTETAGAAPTLIAIYSKKKTILKHKEIHHRSHIVHCETLWQRRSNC